MDARTGITRSADEGSAKDTCSSALTMTLKRCQGPVARRLLLLQAGLGLGGAVTLGELIEALRRGRALVHADEPWRRIALHLERIAGK